LNKYGMPCKHHHIEYNIMNFIPSTINDLINALSLKFLMNISLLRGKVYITCPPPINAPGLAHAFHKEAPHKQKKHSIDLLVSPQGT